MSYIDMSNTDMSNTDMSYTDMSYTDMSYTDMSDTDMSYIDKSNTGMSYTDMSDTDMSDTDMFNTSLFQEPHVLQMLASKAFWASQGGAAEGDCTALRGVNSRRTCGFSLGRDQNSWTTSCLFLEPHVLQMLASKAFWASQGGRRRVVPRLCVG